MPFQAKEIVIDGIAYVECDQCGTCMDLSAPISHTKSQCQIMYANFKPIGNPHEALRLCGYPENYYYCSMCERYFNRLQEIISHFYSEHPPPTTAAPHCGHEQEIKEAQHTLKVQREQIAAFESTQASFKSQIQSLNAKLTVKNAETKNLNGFVSRLQSQNATLKQQIQKQQNNNTQKNAQSKSMKKLNKTLKGLRAENANLKKNASKKLANANQIAQFKAEATRFRSENAKLKEQIAEYKAEATLFQSQHGDLSELERENAQLKARIENLDCEPRQFTKMKAKIDEMCAVVSRELARGMNDLRLKLARSASAAESLSPARKIEYLRGDLTLVALFNSLRRRYEQKLDSECRKIGEFLGRIRGTRKECAHFEQTANELAAHAEEELIRTAQDITSVEDWDTWDFKRFLDYLSLVNRALYVKYESALEKWYDLGGCAVLNINSAFLQVSGITNKKDQATLLGIVEKLRGEDAGQVEGFAETGAV